MRCVGEEEPTLAAAFGWDSEWEGKTGWQRGEIIKGDVMGEQTHLLRARHFRCWMGKGAKIKIAWQTE